MRQTSVLDRGSGTTRYWHRLDGKHVQCDLCPRHCRLREGQRGFCFVRACEEGEVRLTTAGRSSGFCIDPIEKKPLNHFLPGGSVLSFGTAGCNLACKYCQNWDLSKARAHDRLCDDASPAAIAAAALEHGCESVAFTYNDPIVFHEYAIDVAQACTAVGVKAVAVTSGYVCPEPRAEFYAAMDAANVDLKSFDEAFYRRLCGGHLQPVLDTLIYLARSTSVWLEITTLLIPGENDSPAEIAAMTDWIRDQLGDRVPLHFTAFHPDFKLRDHPSTPVATLNRARAIAHRSGLRYVYLGNVPHIDGGTTYCEGCGQPLIIRDGYRIADYRLTADGDCRRCGTHCPGVFAAHPGTWGGRRRPLRLGPMPQPA